MEYFINTIFPFIVVILGVWYLFEKLYSKPKRNKLIEQLTSSGHKFTEDEFKVINKTGFFTGVAREWFPLLCILFIFRAVLWEPFKVASGSMTPNLQKGDFTLTNKHSFGLKNPFTGQVIIDFSGPERGEVIVFKYPLNPEVDYIKRVVGLPGETVVYDQKKITILTKDNTPLHSSLVSLGEYYDKFSDTYLEQYTESLGGTEYNITINKSADIVESTYFQQEDTDINQFVVPEGHYFVLGDNRDDSLDSRYWGFVHKDAIDGVAQVIWLTVAFESTEESIESKPVDFSFERVGIIK